MNYRVTATAELDRSDGFEVLAPDLESAIDMATGIRRRQKDMLVEIRDHAGQVLPHSELHRPRFVRTRYIPTLL